MEKEEISEPAAAAPPGSANGIVDAFPPPSAAVHITLAFCCAVLLAFCLTKASAGALRGVLPLLGGILLLLLLALVQLPAVYWHRHKSAERRDAALMLPWALLLAVLFTQAARTAGTFAFPLRDALWRNLDERLGIRIPEIMALAARHSILQTFLAGCYAMVIPMMLAAIFLPALLGKRAAAEQFLLANAVAFVLALPLMVLLPAVGPWVAWHFAPDPIQRACQMSIDILRKGTVRSDLFPGTVCLPSFHAFWAVVSAHAMHPFRLLRYPAIALACLITIATTTTGWHYGVDVIAGLLLAAIATCLAAAIMSVRRRKAL